MPDAVVDTTVLYAAGNERSQRHDRGLATLQAADHERLPRLRIPDVVLVETMNGLTRDVGHDTAVDMLDRLEARPDSSSTGRGTPSGMQATIRSPGSTDCRPTASSPRTLALTTSTTSRVSTVASTASTVSFGLRTRRSCTRRTN